MSRKYSSSKTAILYGKLLQLTCELTNDNKDEVLHFLAKRPVHTVVMTCWINDNGMVSPHNRGKFYGYRNSTGQLEGVALIGHATLIEARSENALIAFALRAKESEIPLNVVVSAGSEVEGFWKYYAENDNQPRRLCNEIFFEIKTPNPVTGGNSELRLAGKDDLMQVVEAHASVAIQEHGVNPLEKNREQFIERALRRIEQERVWVVVKNGKLVFKADIIAQTSETVYLEGIYVAPEMRGKNVAPNCLSNLSQIFLQTVKSVCLLSNEKAGNAHRAYLKAGFQIQDYCQTIFV